MSPRAHPSGSGTIHGKPHVSGRHTSRRRPRRTWTHVGHIWAHVWAHHIIHVLVLMWHSHFAIFRWRRPISHLHLMLLRLHLHHHLWVHLRSHILWAWTHHGSIGSSRSTHRWVHLSGPHWHAHVIWAHLHPLLLHHHLRVAHHRTAST